MTATGKHDWSRLNRLQLGKYAEYLAKMEFVLWGCDVFTSDVDDHGIDFVIRTRRGNHYDVQVKIAEKLAAIAPFDEPARVFLTNSGTEAVEGAIKVARWHTDRKHIIAFYGAFHGRTLGALSLTASKVIQRDGFFPLIPGVHHVPYGFCHRCPYQLNYGSCGIECVRVIEKTLFRYEVAPDESGCRALCLLSCRDPVSFSAS